MESKLSPTLDELLELGLGKFTDGVGPKARSTKPHKDFLKIEFDDVEVWDDFTEENADTAFGSFFEVMIPTSEAVKSAQAAVNDEGHSPLICVEEDVSALFANRVQPILNAALQQLRVKMQQAVGIRTCRELSMQFKGMVHQGGNSGPSQAKRPNLFLFAEGKFVHCFAPIEANQFWVVGDSTRAQVFDHHDLFIEEAYSKARVTIVKLGMWAKASNTCLAFTMSQHGVTVFRFFHKRNEDGSLRNGAQAQFFPWTAPEGKMAAAKAIWTLIMMSLKEEDRQLVLRNKLRSLDQWPRLQL